MRAAPPRPGRITTSAERMREFADDQQKKLREDAAGRRTQRCAAITKTYRYLFYPSADGPKDAAFCAADRAAAGQGDTNRPGPSRIVRLPTLDLEGAHQRRQPLPAAYVRGQGVGPQPGRHEHRRPPAKRLPAVACHCCSTSTSCSAPSRTASRRASGFHYNRATNGRTADSPPTFWEIGDHTRFMHRQRRNVCNCASKEMAAASANAWR